MPDAEFRYVADEGSTDGWGDAGDSSERFVIEHDGGDDVALDHVTVQYAGASVTGPAMSWLSVTKPSGSTWRTGESWVLEDPDLGSGSDFASDQQVLVLWTTPDGASQILADGDLP
jgi:hypothetical protein